MTAEEFDALGLAVGVVTGARSFKIDKLGRLTGINYPQVWRPGDNNAECRKSVDVIPALSASYQTKTYHAQDLVDRDPVTGDYRTYDGARIPGRDGDYMMRGGGSFTVPVYDTRAVAASITALRPGKPKPADDHSIAKCSHGFYAYYDGSNDYHQTGYVSGVVEGFGETLIGTRGFRAMKARIVAIHIPDHVKPHIKRRVAQNYKDTPQFENFEQMVSEYPTDDGGSGITPDTDPDFWTRSAQ